MSFYASIANLYDYIFPLSPAQVNFAVEKIDDIKNKHLLEVGCGTGNLTLAIAEHCKTIVGVDLDSEMLSLATNKSKKGNIIFHEENMLFLDTLFSSNSFDGIICFGNTIVHLDSLSEIESFLRNCHLILKEKGKLLLQLINYERILNEQVDHLPTLENSTILFERNYDYLKSKHKINFKTKLFYKPNNEMIENEQFLFPITKNELLQLLKNNGFEVQKCFGNFKGEKLDENSVPLIIEAQKI